LIPHQTNSTNFGDVFWTWMKSEEMQCVISIDRGVARNFLRGDEGVWSTGSRGRAPAGVSPEAGDKC